MKSFNVLIIACMIFMGGCASTTVMSDYDEQADFESYKSFGLLPQKDRPDPRSPLNNRFMRARIEDAIQTEMEEKGFRFVQNGRAEIRIAYHVSMKEIIQVDHYGYRRWEGPSRTEVTRYQEGTLIIDFVDTNQKQMVWRGWAMGVISGPNEAEDNIRKAVKRILDKYPPRD